MSENKPTAAEVQKSLDTTRRIAENKKGLYSPEAVQAAKRQIQGLEDLVATLKMEEKGL